MNHVEEIPLHYALSKLRSNNELVDVVALFLAAEIARRRLKKNDRFPINERNVAKALRVSRETVNRAWQHLQMAGLVVLKPGIGVVIVAPNASANKNTSLEVYFSIRINAERQLASQAATLRSNDEIRSMRNALHKMRKAAQPLIRSKSDTVYSNAELADNIFTVFLSDLEFHATMRRAGKEPWLEIVAEIAEAHTQIMRLESLSTPEHFADIVGVHQAILRAITARDAQASEAAVDEHFRVAHKSLKVSKRTK